MRGIYTGFRSQCQNLSEAKDLLTAELSVYLILNYPVAFFRRSTGEIRQFIDNLRLRFSLLPPPPS